MNVSRWAEYRCITYDCENFQSQVSTQLSDDPTAGEHSLIAKAAQKVCEAHGKKYPTGCALKQQLAIYGMTLYKAFHELPNEG